MAPGRNHLCLRLARAGISRRVWTAQAMLGHAGSCLSATLPAAYYYCSSSSNSPFSGSGSGSSSHTSHRYHSTSSTTTTTTPLPLTFADLGVSPDWVARLQRVSRITTPTNTQRDALPTLLQKKHTILRAETGSGKTLCYLLPILQSLEQKVASMQATGGILASASKSNKGANSGGGGGDTRQLVAVGLIVVPTAELVQQVTSIAHTLCPEYTQIIRGCYGSIGVPRRSSCGLIIATPRAVAETISDLHLTELQYVVLDEADALLTGTATRKEVVDNILTRFKMMQPAQRPMHIFAGATLPAKGEASAAAFLDKYYPPQDVQRIVTSGSHKAVSPTAKQTFVQLDADLPLTMFETETQDRMRKKVDAVAEEMGIGPERASKEASVEDNAIEEGREGEDKRGIFVHAASSMTAEEMQQEMEDDPIGRQMLGRIAEDKLLSMRADEKRYFNKINVLRSEAVIEALLLNPSITSSGRDTAQFETTSSESSNTSSITGTSSSNNKDTSPNAELISSGSDTNSPQQQQKAAHKVHPSAVLGFLLDQAPPSSRRLRGVEKREKESVPFMSSSSTISSTSTMDGEITNVTVEMSGNTGDNAATPPTHPPSSSSTTSTTAAAEPTTAAEPQVPRVVPLQLPSRPRSKVSLEQCTTIPPTIVFVNLSETAEAMKKHIAARIPHVRISALHGQVPDAGRAARLADFAGGKIRILVATNLAARGIDTSHVEHVIQAEFATDIVAHLHRIGRTARAGKSGLVTSFFTRANIPLVKEILSSAQAGTNVEDAFSRNRSFKRRVKRKALMAAEDEILEQALASEKTYSPI